MQDSGPGLQWFAFLSSSSSSCPWDVGPADCVPRALTRSSPGMGQEDRQASCPGGFQTALKCKWQVLSPLCFSEPLPGSFMRLQALSSYLWPHFPTSQQGSKDRQRCKNKERRLIGGCVPAEQGDLTCASSGRVALSHGGWEGSVEDQVKRGPSPLVPGGSCIASWVCSNHPFGFVLSTSIQW